LENVGRLGSGMKSLSNTTQRGAPVDFLERAFGDDADGLKQIIQNGVKDAKTSDAVRGILWKTLGGTAGVGGTGYVAHKIANALHGE